MTERGDFEAEELRGLARQHGARRVVVMPATKHFPAVYAWQFPPWICPYCEPDVDARTGCPQPLARHGPQNTD